MAAEGSVYQRQSDERWVAQYTDPNGKTRYIYRKCKGDAKQALRQALKDRDDGLVPPSIMTVAQYLDEWLEDRKDTVSARTWIAQEAILRCHVKPHIGSQKLSKLAGKETYTTSTVRSSQKGCQQPRLGGYTASSIKPYKKLRGSSTSE